METFKCVYPLRLLSGNQAPIRASDNQQFRRVKRDFADQMQVFVVSSVLPTPTTGIDWSSPGCNGRSHSDYMETP